TALKLQTSKFKQHWSGRKVCDRLGEAFMEYLQDEFDEYPFSTNDEDDKVSGHKGEKAKMEKDSFGALILPPYSSLKLPGQKDAIRQIMHETYSKPSIEPLSITPRTKRASYEDYLADDLDEFLNPSKPIGSQVQPIWDLWLAHQAKGEPTVVFTGCKKEDLKAEVEEKWGCRQKGKKKEYIEINEENDGDQCHINPQSPAAHASDKQTQVAFFQTLSKAKSYQDLVPLSSTMITKLRPERQLTLESCFSWQCKLPYLPSKLHNLQSLEATLALFSQALPTSCSSQHFGELTLALGLLLCDSTKVIELEPDVNPIPSYFGQYPFSHQHLDRVLATVQETKDRITAVISSSKRTLPADIST
ncbi:hypothetical protein PAXRUDRAFT_118983, partial [Paxillus rubicundulus Ve08.2h10]